MKYLPLLLLFACSNPDQNVIRVACVGDSITEGAAIRNQRTDSYPSQLARKLGEGYTVMNCGRSGATMLRKSNLPYWNCNELHNALEYEPNIVIIKLGTNDVKPDHWNRAAYIRDYQAMIDTFATLPTKPKLYLCKPVPAYQDNWGIRDSVINADVIPIVDSLAKVNKLIVIDLNTALSNRADDFPDGIHPNEAGAKTMAETIYKVLK